MEVSEVVTLISIVLGALVASGGWIFAWRQMLVNRQFRQEDLFREQRQLKVERVLSHLEEIAELVSLYRIFANASEQLVTDDSGNPVLDSQGRPQIELKSMYPDQHLEDGLKVDEGIDKDSYALVKLQSYRVHRVHGVIGDILADLDPSLEAKNEFGRLYIATRTLEDFIHDRGDIWGFVSKLEELDKRRIEVRRLVQRLVDDKKGSKLK